MSKLVDKGVDGRTNPEQTRSRMTGVFGTLTGHTPTRRSHQEILEHLGTFGLLPPNAKDLLGLPANRELVLAENESGTESIVRTGGKIDPAILRKLMNGEAVEVPSDQYAIAIMNRGINVFCVFIDGSRGIAISQAIRGMYDERGDWTKFFDNLTRAISNPV